MYELQPIPETDQTPLSVEESEATEAQPSTSSKLVLPFDLLPISKLAESTAKKKILNTGKTAIVTNSPYKDK